MKNGNKKMDLIEIVGYTGVIVAWIYLNLNIIFPFILKFSIKYGSLVSILILLFTIGSLVKMNSKIGIEYSLSLSRKYSVDSILKFASILMIPCLALVGYNVLGVWFDFIDLDWGLLEDSMFDKIFFTIFCFSILSIPSNIKEINSRIFM